MKIDIHCHVVGNGRNIDDVDSDVYFFVDDNQHWFTRILYNLLEEDLERLEADLNLDGKISTQEYFDLLYRLVRESKEISGVVLLALDAVYAPETGELDRVKTDLLVSNTFLDGKVKALNQRLVNDPDPRAKGKRFFFGASISPNRKDWETELHAVLTQTDAVLVKCIPSVQHVDLKDPRHRPFFEALARHRVPLLCHVGPEYAFPEGIVEKELDSFRNLEKALERGVTVIGAHCAAPVFPVADPDQMKEFRAFMQHANGDGVVRLWADTSALSLSTRIPLIEEILDRFPPEWLVHGTDFPIPVDSWQHLPWVTHGVTIQEYLQIRKTRNPFDRDVLIKRAHGFSDAILENGEKVLRLNP